MKSYASNSMAMVATEIPQLGGRRDSVDGYLINNPVVQEIFDKNKSELKDIFFSAQSMKVSKQLSTIGLKRHFIDSEAIRKRVKKETGIPDKKEQIAEFTRQ